MGGARGLKLQSPNYYWQEANVLLLFIFWKLRKCLQALVMISDLLYLVIVVASLKFLLAPSGGLWYSGRNKSFLFFAVHIEPVHIAWVQCEPANPF